ncbi:hypothetical protein [Gorillibacterium sp. CAU 1737]|uniref:hypothetical protein n=1 Tax=Gorillibacterium sp. CAU 1737 TaxID=3140362 RepID=UPI00326103BE
MPQLTFGGKYVYGWIQGEANGKVRLPSEALSDYGIIPGERVLLMSGSKTSRGFSVLSVPRMRLHDSPLLEAVQPAFESEGTLLQDTWIQHKGRIFATAELDQDGELHLTDRALQAFGIPEHKRLLSIRSSNIAFVNIVQGPIVDRALTHPEVEVFGG